MNRSSARFPNTDNLIQFIVAKNIYQYSVEYKIVEYKIIEARIDYACFNYFIADSVGISSDRRTDHATLRVLDEIDDLVTERRCGTCITHKFNCICDIEIAQVEDSVHVINDSDLLVGKMVAVQTDRVDSHIRDRFSGSLDKRRNVLVDQRSALKHYVSANVTELMD